MILPPESLLTPCVLFQMRTVLAALLVGASLGAPDKAGHGHGPSQEGYGGGGNQQFYTPQVKYAGPIVYSGEKPPIIHFPPPPEVSIIRA